MGGGRGRTEGRRGGGVRSKGGGGGGMGSRVREGGNGCGTLRGEWRGME